MATVLKDSTSRLLELNRRNRELENKVSALTQELNSTNQEYESQIDDLTDDVEYYKLKASWRWIFYLYGMLTGALLASALLIYTWVTRI